jgi:hypothetical protein
MRLNAPRWRLGASTATNNSGCTVKPRARKFGYPGGTTNARVLKPSALPGTTDRFLGLDEIVTRWIDYFHALPYPPGGITYRRFDQYRGNSKQNALRARCRVTPSVQRVPRAEARHYTPRYNGSVNTGTHMQRADTGTIGYA